MKRKILLIFIVICLATVTLRLYNDAARTALPSTSHTRDLNQNPLGYQQRTTRLQFEELSPGLRSQHFQTQSDEQLASERQNHPDRLRISEPNSVVSTKGVLILTNYRSGSTFFGELFNQHPDVYYSYEPLAAVQHRNETEMLQVLESIFSCRIRGVSEYIHENERKNELTHLQEKCLEDNVCFRSKIKSLCSPTYCVFPRTCTRCKKMLGEELSSKCNSKKVSVAKVIRLVNLTTMRSLIEEKKMDVKILHLVRDPRGISSSRRKIRPYTDKHMANTCKRLLKNALVGLTRSYPWLEGRYKLIRYEDVASNPVEMAEDVYDFVGLKMTEGIERWIEISTQGNVKLSEDKRAEKLKAIRRRKRRRKLPQKNFEKIILSDAYSTVRHSNETWQAWKHSLDSTDIKIIQEDCWEAMKLLGYNLFPPNGVSLTDFAPLAPLPPFNGKTIRPLVNRGIS